MIQKHCAHCSSPVERDAITCPYCGENADRSEERSGREGIFIQVLNWGCLVMVSVILVAFLLLIITSWK